MRKQEKIQKTHAFLLLSVAAVKKDQKSELMWSECLPSGPPCDLGCTRMLFAKPSIHLSKMKHHDQNSNPARGVHE